MSPVTPEDLVQQRLLRIAARKAQIGSQQDRVLKRFSPGFLLIFDFFLRAARQQVLTFSGGGGTVRVSGDPRASDARLSFREYDNGRHKVYCPQTGRYQETHVVTRHPNLLWAVIQAKKAWGLWVKEWAEGIADGLFTKAEIWGVFTGIDVGLPLDEAIYPAWLRQEFALGYAWQLPTPFFQELETAIERARLANPGGTEARHQLVRTLLLPLA